MAERLVEAWKVHGGRPEVPQGEDELIFARRIVAQRCLYGVDRNPMAVDLAKMSLWLATLASDEPLTFVDHALRDGDSLVGLTRKQIAAFTWKRGSFQPEHGMRVDNAVADAEALRQMIREAKAKVSHEELEAMWQAAEAALDDVRSYGDLAVEAFFLETKVKARERRRLAHLADVQRDEMLVHRERLAERRNGHPPLAPFHWEIEFPEVFQRNNPGFDVFVGNPPFAGSVTVVRANVAHYTRWLRELHSGTGGKCDVVAHFFRRAFALVREGGTLGLIATNTIAQGDTRTSGLRWICENGGIVYEAQTRRTWPGQAAVVVSVVHIARRSYAGVKRLDGRESEEITAFLFTHGGHRNPERLRENTGQNFLGSKIDGIGFTFDDTDRKGVASPLAEMRRLIEKEPRNGELILPYIGGQEVNTSPTHSSHRYVINFGHMPLWRSELGKLWRVADDEQRRAWLREGVVPIDYPDPVAADWPDLLKIVEERVKPERLKAAQKSKSSYAKRAAVWWQLYHQAHALNAAIVQLDRVLAISRVGQQAAFAFLPVGTVFAETLVIFPFNTHAAFCALQSRPHEIWARFFGSSMKDDLRYTPTDVFETYPFPIGWASDPALEAAGEAYYSFRADLMRDNNEGLTKTYNRFHNPDECDPNIIHLRELHTAMDRVVLAAYGWSDIDTACDFLLEYEIDEAESIPKKKPWRYRWPDPVRDEVLSRLMTLNVDRADEE